LFPWFVHRSVVQSCVRVSPLRLERDKMSGATIQKSICSSHKLDFKFVRLFMAPMKCIRVENHVDSTRTQLSRFPEINMSGAISAAGSSHSRHIPSDACQPKNAPPPEPNISFEAFYLNEQLQDPDIPTQTPLPRTGSLKAHRSSQFIFIGT
jgi:hypothetical protein